MCYTIGFAKVKIRPNLFGRTAKKLFNFCKTYFLAHNFKALKTELKYRNDISKTKALTVLGSRLDMHTCIRVLARLHE